MLLKRCQEVCNSTGPHCLIVTINRPWQKNAGGWGTLLGTMSPTLGLQGERGLLKTISRGNNTYKITNFFQQLTTGTDQKKRSFSLSNFLDY